MSKLPNLQIISRQARSGVGSITGKLFFGIGVLSGFLSFYSYFQSFGAEKEVEFRKNQLKLPVYKLTDEQLVNPPWNHDNLGSWLYRRGITS